VRKLWLLLVVLLVAVPAQGEEGDAAKVLEISRAQVLSSPGTPKALEPFLPGGSLGKRLTWPLPYGPVLVLGLPATDPKARAIADVFHLPVEPQDLRGGYGLWAWHDGTRSLVIVMAADPAALYAARFEFHAAAPMGANHPDARSLDFERPNEEAGLVVEAGTRFVRPRYRLRGIAPVGAGRDDPAAAVAGARGNRLWLDPSATPFERAAGRLASLREQGVTPVVVTRWALQPEDDANVISVEAEGLARGLRGWQQVHGVRHFALVFETDRAIAQRLGGSLGKLEARLARDLARRLRPDLEELVVVPRCHSDRLARTIGSPPDLRDVPEAVVAWSGPLEHSVQITRADAERRVREAGVPVVLYDTWAAPFQDDKDMAHVPCAPYGRAPDLHDVLDGVVVVGERHTEAMLDSAWGPVTDERFGASLLGPLLPVGDLDPLAFLRRSSEALERQADEDAGFVAWMRPLAFALRDATTEIESGTPALTVPVVPAGVIPDGKVDEPSWGFARRVPTEDADAHILVLSDGRRLWLALRNHVPVVRTGPPVVQVRLRIPETDVTWRATLDTRGASVQRHPESTPRDPVRVEVLVDGLPASAEIAFDRFALFGEAIPTRRFELAVFHGTERIWPPADSKHGRGLLVVTR
jgi:hypothetical protein